ncbi:hypothetical protein CDEST_12907 [Colletotrichum destructivum]|uniref:Uncharacterized protein n=1 Tax=Colletotrichum destructivum TaxID=34406 RepID=A0AAX4IXL0_9PEZI|nr:hypothetical protein CDEST_12907 [Colletotrichum destructivum]
MPTIDSLLEVSTVASVNTTEGKKKTRRQRRSSPENKKDSPQNTVQKFGPHATGMSPDCPAYQYSGLFKLLYQKVDRDKKDPSGFDINGRRHSANNHGIGLK